MTLRTQPLAILAKQLSRERTLLTRVTYALETPILRG